MCGRIIGYTYILMYVSDTNSTRWRPTIQFIYNHCGDRGTKWWISPTFYLSVTWRFEMRMHRKQERIKWVCNGKSVNVQLLFLTWCGLQTHQHTDIPYCSALRESRIHVYLVNSRNTSVAHPWRGTMLCRRAFEIWKSFILQLAVGNAVIHAFYISKSEVISSC